MLTPGRFIPIPNSAGSAFDHGAYDPTTGRVFVAHTAANTVEFLAPREGRTGSCATEARAGTTALVPPDRLYVFLRGRGGALELIEADV
jgi:hypothetical protein